MPLIQIEQNDPKTLDLAQGAIRRVTTAQSTTAMDINWAMAAGHFSALYVHKLIDKATYERLDAECDQARADWQAANPRLYAAEFE